MAGFSGLVIVRHPGLNSMGLVALVGLANCFLAAVVLLPDSGAKYLSKVYNDNWMRENQYLETIV